MWVICFWLEAKLKNSRNFNFQIFKIEMESASSIDTEDETESGDSNGNYVHIELFYLEDCCVNLLVTIIIFKLKD